MAGMRLRWLLISLALVALAFEASAETRDGGGLDHGLGPRLPPVTAAALLVPPAVLERLPPGARRPEEPASLAATNAEADVSRRAYVIERIEDPSSQPDAPGWLDVEYTVDALLDERVRGVLERGRISLGHVILMDPASGEVFSYVSTAPEIFPATRPYPTASLMKVVTAAAVLRNGPEATSRACRYLGSPYRMSTAQLEPPTSGGRVDSFWRAIAISNNQCFARLAVHDVGKDALLSEIRRAGLLEAPAARHPAGLVEPIEDALALGYLGSGLAGSFITPLAAARLAALLAQGELVRPYWIARVRDAHGKPLIVPGRRTPRPVWPRQVTDELRELMVNVTERGTARRAFRGQHGQPLLGSIRVSGKTGSLSGTNPGGRYEWFIGVAPAAAPRIAIATVVVNGPSGRGSASEVAAATLREVFCEGEHCDASRVEQLHARSRARAAEAEREIREAALREMDDLDRIPHPIGAPSLEFPRRLLKKKVSGKIVLLLELDREGRVLDVQIDSSDLPDFDDFVLSEVSTWEFTPPTRRGHPVRAEARLPIPIEIH
jgi:TonB family protein